MLALEQSLAAFALELGLNQEVVQKLTAFVRESSGASRSDPISSSFSAALNSPHGSGSDAGNSLGIGGSPAGVATRPLGLPPERYEERGSLGVGGMGEVFRVHERTLNRVVALKVLKTNRALRPSWVTRFSQEAQLTAQLQHPGIVPVYEIGHLPDGRPFFTMREIRGRTLRDVITSAHAAVKNGQWDSNPDGWSLRRLVESFHRVCEAVAYAHDRGVVHRDLKPDNIMLGAYGEVLVLDWGIAKVVASQDTGQPEDNEPLVGATSVPVTRPGGVAGTAAYMSPEQARGEIDAAGPRSDVFSLGAVLYEILCNRPPFINRQGPTVVAAASSEPGRSTSSSLLEFPDHPQIREELKAICERALAEDKAARHADAGELGADVSLWLEGTKNLSRARDLLKAAASHIDGIDALRSQASGLRHQARQILDSMPAFVPVEVKNPGWEMEDGAVELERKADALAVRFRQTVWSALTFHSDLPEAHTLLADHYAKEHLRAESLGMGEDATKLEVLLRDHDRGTHAKYLKGEGSLTLVTDPPGATAELYRFVLRDRRLQLTSAGNLGVTPLHQVPLAMGSYLVVVRLAGRQDVQYPVNIRRREAWSGVPPEGGAAASVYLPLQGELEPDEVYVPAGWFSSGGDAGAIGRRSVMPQRRLWLDGFAIRRHQVTIGEYVDFLNVLIREGREQEAMLAAPRAAGRQDELGALLIDRASDGTFFIPPNNYYGIPWQPEWPVIFVDWFGAMAYTRYVAAKAGKSFRLPTELEWEKAARGVDGRRFPWGDFLDPTWCRMLETHQALPTMAAAGSYEVDQSPYGVRDMAGNQRDWCLDVPTEQGPPVSDSGRPLGYLDSHEAWNVRVARGGNFLDSPLWCWTYHRSSFLPHVRDYIVSFRTARSIAAPDPVPIQLAPRPHQ